jgi:hypothetical protein
VPNAVKMDLGLADHLPDIFANRAEIPAHDKARKRGYCAGARIQ